MHEARYYDIVDGDALCRLCPHECRIKADKYGSCGVRKFSQKLPGLVPENYAVISSQAVDPVEKKPLYHFYPGRDVFSVGTYGCNLSCRWCQNWQISQSRVPQNSQKIEPEKLIISCIRAGTDMIAYTYSEPVVWFEYVIESSVLAHEKGIKNVLVTNANCNIDPWKELMQVTDACNIDLKGFNKETLASFTGASFSHVCKAIELAAGNSHVEITTLIVPGFNDNYSELKSMISFIASIDRNIPWHITRYFPNYRYSEPPTDVSFIERIRQEAKEKLNFVYCGNYASSSGSSDTDCPSCGRTVISRKGYMTETAGLNGSACAFCGEQLPVIV